MSPEFLDLHACELLPFLSPERMDAAGIGERALYRAYARVRMAQRARTRE